MNRDPSPCTVERKCSSTGRACALEDRSCQAEAIASGLEVTCERVEPREWIYCPPGAQQRDSSAVWVLLAFALAVAAIGSVLSYMLIRKQTTTDGKPQGGPPA
jgi:hypothetical protein